MKKLDLSKPMQMRNGTPVRLLCSDLKHPDGFNLLFAYLSDSNNEVLLRTTPDGLSGMPVCSVENVPNKKSEFINVYEDTEKGIHWDTLEQARKTVASCSSSIMPDIKILEYIYEDDKLVDIKVHDPK